MTPLDKVSGKACLLSSPDINTDQIIPARFLMRSRSEDYAKLLFHDIRFRGGETEVPDFPIQSRLAGKMPFLVAGRNFGCGSAREQAVWALADYGFRVILSESFGGIFEANCVENGLLPIRLPAAEAIALQESLTDNPDTPLSVDLERQELVFGNKPPLHFDAKAWRQRLLDGLDSIALTLQHLDKIVGYEKRSGKGIV